MAWNGNSPSKQGPGPSLALPATVRCRMMRPDLMSARLLFLAGLLVTATPQFVGAAQRIYQFRPTTNDIVFADFEGTNWGAWTATGYAFGNAPAHGALTNQQPVTGYQGRG